MPSITVTVGPQPAKTVEVSDPSLTATLTEGFREIVRLGDLLDVDITGLEDGGVLVYDFDNSKWIVTRTLEKQFINPGQF